MNIQEQFEQWAKLKLLILRKEKDYNNEWQYLNEVTKLCFNAWEEGYDLGHEEGYNNGYGHGVTVGTGTNQ
jgi:hypothetical protein